MAFFQKVWFFFFDLQISKKNIPKNYPELEISISRQKRFTVIGGKSKFQAQDSFLEYYFLKIWRFEKQIALSEKKPPLSTRHKRLGWKFCHLQRSVNSTLIHIGNLASRFLLCALKSAREIITGFALSLVLNPEVFDGETLVIDWSFVTVVTRKSYCHHPLSFHKNKNPTRSQN